MAASASDLVGSIEPGSIPQGDRAGLEQGLAGLGGGGAGSSAVAAGAAAAPTGGNDPISALLSGDVDPGGQGPITDGLSVGPGDGPATEPQSPQIIRLQQIATQASSPLLRSAARNELRRIVGEAV